MRSRRRSDDERTAEQIHRSLGAFEARVREANEALGDAEVPLSALRLEAVRGDLDNLAYRVMLNRRWRRLRRRWRQDPG